MVGDRPPTVLATKSQSTGLSRRILRVNYPVDTPGLAAHARIDSFRSTWPADADYARNAATHRLGRIRLRANHTPISISPLPATAS